MPPVQESLQQLLEVDNLCESFEAEWAAGHAPSIESYLAKVAESMRPELLRELLGLDVSRRLSLGEQPAIDDYRSRFLQYLPDVENALKRLLEIADKPSSIPVPQPGDKRSATAAGSTVPQGLDPTCDAKCNGEIDRVAATLQAGAWRPMPVESSTPTFPTALGRYELKSMLGRGAFGTVYRGWDPLLCRDVAIKVLRGRIVEDDAIQQQLVQEARAVVRLKHPHIVAVHDVGQSDAGERFIVMDFIDGRPLQQILRERKRLPVKDAMDLVIKLADAISAAHREGIYHRDLKPGNIMVSLAGEPCIVDFGMAVNDQTRRLKKGELSGTWPYMSPEQLRGEAHLLDGRSDIWALGVILYEVLVGRRPFGGENLNQLSEEILRKSPTPVRQLESSLPAELDRIVQRALAKNPAERYATAQDLARDLRRAAQRRPRIWLEAVAAATVAGAICFGAASYLTPTGTPLPTPTPSTMGRFEPTLKLHLYDRPDSREEVSFDPNKPIFHGQYVRLEVTNPDPVYLCVYWVDEAGKAERVYPEEHELDNQQAQTTWQSERAFPVQGEAGSDYLVVGVSAKPVRREDLAQLDSRTFPWPSDRGRGRSVAFVDGPPRLQEVLAKMCDKGVFSKHVGRAFDHQPRSP